jgi:hypothetical protein
MIAARVCMWPPVTHQAVTVRHEPGGTSTTWHLHSVVVQDQATGRCWDFEHGGWLGEAGQTVAASVTLDQPISYGVLKYQKAGGRVTVGPKGTEIRLCTMNFIPFHRIDLYISVLIMASLILDVWREEFVRACITDAHTNSTGGYCEHIVDDDDDDDDDIATTWKPGRGGAWAGRRLGGWAG